MGGLIAILKIGFILSLVHGRQYQRYIRELGNKKKDGEDEKDCIECVENKFTLETFQLMIDTSSSHQREIRMNNNQIELLTTQLQATLNTAEEASNLKIRIEQQLERI